MSCEKVAAVGAEAGLPKIAIPIAKRSLSADAYKLLFQALYIDPAIVVLGLAALAGGR
jgi:hypothetical protein